MAKNILIVDDDVTSLKQLESVLIDKNYEVTTASDGDVGLECVSKAIPDLILLDIEMPRMNGYFFMGELRKIAGCENVPVIIITSHENMKRAFSGKGIKDYILKPFDINKLILIIEKYI